MLTLDQDDKVLFQDGAFKVEIQNKHFRICWTTLDGESHSGLLDEIDNYTLIMKCDDGKTRALDGEWLLRIPDPDVQ